MTGLLLLLFALMSMLGDLRAASNSPSLLRGDSWQLDLLGNWIQRTEQSSSSSTVLTHTPSNRNELLQITRTPGTNPTETITPIHDAAGNLLFDGALVYQYDAWNRLVQVNLGALDNGTILVNQLVKHMTYDGLGRLVRVQAPYPTPQTGQGNLRTERFHYDGIRRIQEIIIDPLQDTDDSAMSGNMAAIQALAEQPDLDGSATALASESEQIDDPSPIPTVSMQSPEARLRGKGVARGGAINLPAPAGVPRGHNRDRFFAACKHRDMAACLSPSRGAAGRPLYAHYCRAGCESSRPFGFQGTPLRDLGGVFAFSAAFGRVWEGRDRRGGLSRSGRGITGLDGSAPLTCSMPCWTSDIDNSLYP